MLLSDGHPVGEASSPAGGAAFNSKKAMSGAGEGGEGGLDGGRDGGGGEGLGTGVGDGEADGEVTSPPTAMPAAAAAAAAATGSLPITTAAAAAPAVHSKSSAWLSRRCEQHAQHDGKQAFTGVCGTQC